jgi:cytochrome c oxidase subunit 2
MGKTTRTTRKQARQRQKNIRTLSFILIVGGVLILAGFFLKPVLFRPALPALAGNVIDVSAGMDGFDKTEIHIKLGQPVSIRLTSMDNSAHTDGGGKHQFAVDELGVNIIAQPEGSSSFTFTPDKSGTFTFYCDICCGGRANPSMNGALIVDG